MECTWFIFSDLLRAELDKMKEEWNTQMKCTFSQSIKNCGIVISREKINYILDEKGVYYEAHCLMKTCDELLKQYFTHLELVGVMMLPKDWAKARNIYDLIVSSSSFFF